MANRAAGPSSVGRLAMLEHCQAPRSSPRRPTSSRSTVPRCRRTSRRLRDVPSSRFTRHRPSGATLQRRFGGSASNAPREQPTGNLDGRRVKCSTMMAAALHGQNENYPPTHIPKSTYARNMGGCRVIVRPSILDTPFCETTSSPRQDPLSASLRALVESGGAP